jgi:exonuclease III
MFGSRMIVAMTAIFALFAPLTVYAETFCPTVTNPNADRRQDKNTLRIMQYNVEWLFTDYYKNADCPGAGCTWQNETIAQTHIQYVANVINDVQPDIMNLCEVEGCDELDELIKQTSPEYNPYLIQGSDTSTGQNVGMLTKINPSVSLYRSEERVSYPVPGSKCGYNGSPGTSGVTKHYITEFQWQNMKVLYIGLHLLAYPTDTTRCAEREAQATVIQNIIVPYIQKGYEVIVMGDFNDFDEDPLDANNNKPISHVLDIVRGKNTNIYQLYNVASTITKSDRYSDWWDKNGDCKSTPDEFSTIDHLLVTPGLQTKIKSAYYYHKYEEFCGTYNSDHYPLILELGI